MVASPELLMPQTTPCALFPAGLIEQSFFNPPKPVVRLEGGGSGRWSCPTALTYCSPYRAGDMLWWNSFSPPGAKPWAGWLSSPLIL